MDMKEISVVVLVDEDGNYVVGIDIDSANEKWDDDISGHWSRRVDVKLTVDVAPSVVEVTVPMKPAPVVSVSV